MYEKIIIFKTKLLFLKIYYRNIRYNYGTTLRGELVGELSETVMILIRNDLLAHLPTQFSGISSYEISFATISVFTKIPCHALTPNSRLPSAYENALCHFQNYLQYVNMHIFNQLQLHTCNSTLQSSPNLAHLEQIIIITNGLQHNLILYNCVIVLTSQALT